MKLHESQRSIWTLDFQSNWNRVLLFLSVNSHQQNEVFSTTNKMAGHKLEGEWSHADSNWNNLSLPPQKDIIVLSTESNNLSMLLVLIYTLQTTWMGHFKYELPLPFTVHFWEWSLIAYCLLIPGMTIEIYNSTITWIIEAMQNIDIGLNSNHFMWDFELVLIQLVQITSPDRSL